MTTNTLPGAPERTPNTSPQLTGDHLEQLHALFWKLYDLETYVALAHAVTQEDLRRYTDPEDAVELMVKQAHDVIGAMIEGFDELATALSIAFSRKGIQTQDDQALPEDALAAVCARHDISPEAMLAAVAEILNAALDRPDAWETETAGRLLTLAKDLEG